MHPPTPPHAPQVLHAAGISKPQAVAVAYSARQRAVHAVETMHEHYPDVPIYVRAIDTKHAAELEAAGAHRTASLVVGWPPSSAALGSNRVAVAECQPACPWLYPSLTALSCSILPALALHPLPPLPHSASHPPIYTPVPPGRCHCGGDGRDGGGAGAGRSADERGPGRLQRSLLGAGDGAAPGPER